MIGAALALVMAWQASAPAAATPPPTAEDLFLSAQARERTIRAALDALPTEPPPTRDAMRQVVAAYRQVVLRYPKSGYCDDALWLAARLAADTFVRHGDERDRTAALQLIDSLAREYPSSSFVRSVKAERARVTAMGSSAAPAKPADPAAAKPADTAAARPPETAGVGTAETVLVRDVRRLTAGAAAIVEIEMDGPVQFREERLYHPSRVFFDLPKTRTTDAFRDATLSFDSGPIRQVRDRAAPEQHDAHRDGYGGGRALRVAAGARALSARGDLRQRSRPRPCAEPRRRHCPCGCPRGGA